jgi:hypothetical protein
MSEMGTRGIRHMHKRETAHDSSPAALRLSLEFRLEEFRLEDLRLRA